MGKGLPLSNPFPLKNILITLACLAFIACTMKKETAALTQDSLAIHNASQITNSNPQPTYETPYATSIKNFFDYNTEPLTDDETEKVVHNTLISILNQYDTMFLHTVTMHYVEPGTEQTADGDLTSSKDITVTLFYDNDTTLRAVQHQFYYTLEGVNGFWKQYYIYTLNDGLEAYYEDHLETIDMPVANFRRAVARLCLSACGVSLSGSNVTGQVTVAKELNEEDFYGFARRTDNLEGEVLEYLAFSDLRLSEDEYVYQTEAALDENSNYDVFYSVSKSYYDRFVKK